MKRTLLAILLAVLTAIGFATFAVGNAEAWKCEVHPERSTCTTTTPPLNSTTLITTSTVPDTTTTVTVTTTTVPEATTTTVPVTSTVPPAPPTPPKFAG